MAVALVASSTSGTTDAQGTSRTCPVPAGAASGHVAVLALELWQSTTTNPAITWPSGFVEIASYASTTDQFQKVKVARKVLTGADSGNYSMSWSATHFNQAQCTLWSGVDNTTPLDVAVSLAQGTATGNPANSLTTANAGCGMLHIVANENTSTSTPPTGYTEQQEANYLKTNTKIAGSAGTETPSGGSQSVSNLQLGVLVALRAASGGGGNNTATSPAAETDTGIAVGRTRQTAVTPATVTNVGVPIGNTRTTTVTPAAETDTGQTVGRTRQTAVAPALEVDTGIAFGSPNVTPTSPAVETDTGVAVGRTRATSTGVGAETDTGQPVGRTRATTAGIAGETDMGVTLGRTRATPVTPAVEVDTGQALFVPASDFLLSAYVEPDRLFVEVDSQWHSEVEPDRLTAEVQR